MIRISVFFFKRFGQMLMCSISNTWSVRYLVTAYSVTRYHTQSQHVVLNWLISAVLLIYWSSVQSFHTPLVTANCSRGDNFPWLGFTDSGSDESLHKISKRGPLIPFNEAGIRWRNGGPMLKHPKKDQPFPLKKVEQGLNIFLTLLQTSPLLWQTIKQWL